MQTFLPFPSFVASARALDPVRLGKQRVETLQLLRANTMADYGWRHHPAAKMWNGHVPALVAYGLAMTDAWTQLGRADTVREKILAFAPEVDGIAEGGLDLPWWVGDAEFHLAHRSNLLRKDRAFYEPLFGDIPDDLPYVWPGPTQTA